MHISQYHPFRVVLNTLTCKVTHATRVTRLLLFSLTKSAQKSVWVQVVQIRNYVCFLKTEGTKAKRHESGVCIGSSGGRGEIRTHGGLATTTVFKTVALNRSATLPSFPLQFQRKQDYSKEFVIWKPQLSIIFCPGKNTSV